MSGRRTANATMCAVARERGVPLARQQNALQFVPEQHVLACPAPVTEAPAPSPKPPERFVHVPADPETAAWNQQREREWEIAQRRIVHAEADAETVAENRRREAAWHAATAGLETILRALSPVFSEPVRPLKIGIFEDLQLLLAGEFPPELISRFLRDWCRRPAYRRAVAAGGARYDLDGQPAGGVTEEEQADARRRL